MPSVNTIANPLRAANQYWLMRIKTKIARPAITTTMAATNAAVSVRLRCGAFMYHGIGASSFLLSEQTPTRTNWYRKARRGRLLACCMPCLTPCGRTSNPPRTFSGADDGTACLHHHHEPGGHLLQFEPRVRATHRHRGRDLSRIRRRRHSENWDNQREHRRIFSVRFNWRLWTRVNITSH